MVSGWYLAFQLTYGYLVSCSLDTFPKHCFVSVSLLACGVMCAYAFPRMSPYPTTNKLKDQLRSARSNVTKNG